MTDFKAWIPPAGAVIDPPVHERTIVEVIYSDGTFSGDEIPARRINWSAEGDGPRVVAYAVIEEYKPAPKVAREWWMLRENDLLIGAWKSENHAKTIARPYKAPEVIHVREVLPGREVVAWAVVEDDDTPALFTNEKAAANFARQMGGAVVRLTGVMP